MCIKAILIIVCCFFKQNQVRSEVSNNYFFRVKGVTVSEQENDFHQTKQQCSLRCIAGCRKCFVISYDVVTSVCRHFDQLNTTLVVTETPSTYLVWIRNETMRVYPVRRAGDNGISFEDAPAVCSNLGGYLANTSDLQTAQRLGLHLCRCGILRNNSTRYSALYNGTNCSDYAGLPPPTIVTCKLPTTNTYLSPAPLAYCVL
ncbi:uncharacterized protein LOC127848681 [Dreissena polymorpha]|uniref:uncharacterized protein LOC127848681 n=1 Tax=Dreissena polymorpha TaxID=45954 RepID=UPI0022650616|nr:uncharacterized protein LOC127848681 [Dreissena polymorpha]